MRAPPFLPRPSTVRPPILCTLVSCHTPLLRRRRPFRSSSAQDASSSRRATCIARSVLRGGCARGFLALTELWALSQSVHQIELAERAEAGIGIGFPVRRECSVDQRDPGGIGWPDSSERLAAARNQVDAYHV